MKKASGWFRRILAAVFVLLLTALFTAGCAGAASKTEKNSGQGKAEAAVQQTETADKQKGDGAKQADPEENREEEILESEEYSSTEEVAEYLYLYGHLPDNYITKNEAKELGWDSSKGNLWDVAPGKSIGGDKFGNREGLLPEKKGRTYYECDVNYEGGYRGSDRIIYSSDGLVYFTEDHYNSFELLYEDGKGTKGADADRNR